MTDKDADMVITDLEDWFRMTDHTAVIRAAADAIEAYWEWDNRTRGPLCEFTRRARALGGKAAPRRGEKAALLRERQAYLRRNPQPVTADAILSEHCGGDMRLYGLLCGEVTEEMKRRAMREAA